MLFSLPHTGETGGTGRWATRYNFFVDNKFHEVVVEVLHMTPSYEIIDLHITVPEALEDKPVAEYARQVVLQQSMTEYSAHAERMAKEKAEGSQPVVKKTRRRKAGLHGLSPNLFNEG